MATLLIILGAVTFTALMLFSLWALYQIISTLILDWSMRVGIDEKIYYGVEYLKCRICDKIYKFLLFLYGKSVENETMFHNDFEVIDELQINTMKQMNPFELNEFFRCQIGNKYRSIKGFDEFIINEIKSKGYLNSFWGTLKK